MMVPSVNMVIPVGKSALFATGAIALASFAVLLPANPPLSVPPARIDVAADDPAWNLRVENSDPIWTTKPVRIDRSRQTFERIRLSPDLYPLKLDVAPGVVVRDGGSFSMDGRHYIIAGLVPVPAMEICTEASGRRWACGAKARAALRTLLRGHRIACRSSSLARNVSMLDCRVKGSSLAQMLIRAGAGSAP